MKNYTITVNGNVYEVHPAQQHRDVQLQSQLQHRQPQQHQLLQQEPETLRSKQEQPERYSRLRRKSAML